MNSSIDIDKNNLFLGYYYGVGEVLTLNFTPQPGMLFVNGETNSVWVWDALSRMWIDTNRVDNGMKGMLNNNPGNSPTDFDPKPLRGVKESYFYVAECEDLDANPEAESKTITFTHFKNGENSVSVEVRKTSVVTLFWNGDYWETNVVPFINADYSLYATKFDLSAEESRAMEAERRVQKGISSFYECIYNGKSLQCTDIRENFYIDAYSQIKESFTRSVNLALFYDIDGYEVLSLSLLSGNMATVVYKFFSDTELTSPIDDLMVNAPILITDDSGVRLDNYIVNIPSGAKAVAVCYNKQEALNVFAGSMRFAETDKVEALQENLSLLSKEIEGYYSVDENSLEILQGKISPADASTQPSDAFAHYQISFERGRYSSLKARMLLYSSAGYAFYDENGEPILSSKSTVANNGDWQEIAVPAEAVLFKNTICKKEAPTDWQYLYFPIERVLLNDGSFSDSLKGKLDNVTDKTNSNSGFWLSSSSKLPYEVRSGKRALKLLVIGNSWSENATLYLQPILADMGVDSTIYVAKKSSGTLKDCYKSIVNNAKDYNLIVNGRYEGGLTTYFSLNDIFSSDVFDVVVLQQQSGSAGDYSSYQPYLHNLLSHINSVMDNNPLIYFHSTWSYPNGCDHADFLKYDNDSDKMYNSVIASWSMAIEEEGVVKVLPSAYAIQELRGAGIADIDETDGKHLSTNGCFIVGCVWAEVMCREVGLNKTVSELNYNPTSLPRSEYERVKSIAITAVERIEEDYKRAISPRLSSTNVKQIVSLGQVSNEELKNYIENGIYEGVIVDSERITSEQLLGEIEEFDSAIQQGSVQELPTGSQFAMEVLNNSEIEQKLSQIIGEEIGTTIVQRIKCVTLTRNYFELYRIIDVIEGVCSSWEKIG